MKTIALKMLLPLSFSFVSIESLAASNDHETFVKLEKSAYSLSNTKKTDELKLDHSSEVFKESFVDLFPTLGVGYSKTTIELDGVETESESKNASLSYNLTNLAFYPITYQVNDLNHTISGVEVEQSQKVFKNGFRKNLISLREAVKKTKNIETLFALEMKDFQNTEKKFKRGAVSKLGYLRSKNSVDATRNDFENVSKATETKLSNFSATYKLSKEETESLLRSNLTSNGSVLNHSKELLVKLKTMKVVNNYSLKESKYENDLLKLQKKREIKSYLPDLSLSYRQNLDTEETTYTVGLTMSLSTVLKDTSHFKAARKDYLTSTYSYDDKKTSAENSKNDLSDSITVAINNYKYNLEALKSVKEILDLSKDSYNKGKIESSVLIADWQKYVSTSNNVINKKHLLMKVINDAELFVGDLSNGSYIF
ncbi:TolC family protein [bacterium]|nr:TolC family protein [bacterium]